MIKTQRLYLRTYETTDVEVLYELCKDPDVGPDCGWMPHKDLDEARFVLENILINDWTWAIVERDTNKLVGNISLMRQNDSHLVIDDTSAEIGFWLGKPYWGKGYMPEACLALMNYAFEDMGIKTLWIQHHEHNQKSARVQAKCGFVYHHKDNNKYYPLLDVYRNNVVNYMTKEMWETCK